MVWSHLHVCSFAIFSVTLSHFLSVCLPANMPVLVCICVCMFVCVSVCLCQSLSVSLYLSLSLCQSVCLSFTLEDSNWRIISIRCLQRSRILHSNFLPFSLHEVAMK